MLSISYPLLVDCLALVIGGVLGVIVSRFLSNKARRNIQNCVVIVLTAFITLCFGLLLKMKVDISGIYLLGIALLYGFVFDKSKTIKDLIEK